MPEKWATAAEPTEPRQMCIRDRFYGLCVFTIVFRLFWMALPKLSLPVPDPGSEAPPSSAADLANIIRTYSKNPDVATLRRSHLLEDNSDAVSNDNRSYDTMSTSKSGCLQI